MRIMEAERDGKSRMGEGGRREVYECMCECAVTNKNSNVRKNR